MYTIKYDYLISFLQIQLQAYYFKYHKTQDCPIQIKSCYSRFFNNVSGGKYYSNGQTVLEYEENGSLHTCTKELHFSLTKDGFQIKHSVLDNILYLLGRIVNQGCFPLRVTYNLNGITRISNSTTLGNEQSLTLSAWIECLMFESISSLEDEHNMLIDSNEKNKMNETIILAIQEKIFSLIYYEKLEKLENLKILQVE